MKKSKPIIVSEYRNWLAFYTLIFVFGLIGTIVDILALFSDKYDVGYPGPSFLALLLVPIIAYFHIRKKGRIEITEDHIYVKYPHMVSRTSIDLNKQVY